MNRQADARVSRTVQHLLVDRPGVTRADLADACGINYNALAMKLRGDRPWRLDEILCVAEFFDVPIGRLFYPPRWEHDSPDRPSNQDINLPLVAA